MSSLPANLPLIGGLVGDMADVLVLTKNQVLLLFKLAGLYGRDLRARAPAAGRRSCPSSAGRSSGARPREPWSDCCPACSGCCPRRWWRTRARTSSGEMARYYFRYGHKPPPDMVREPARRRHAPGARNAGPPDADRSVQPRRSLRGAIRRDSDVAHRRAMVQHLVDLGAHRQVDAVAPRRARRPPARRGCPR